MPFTPSHAAAVVPLLRTPLPASALVIGSMAPDIPYYLPAWPEWPTHTALAVVTTDLLLGGAAWAIWHGVLAAPALAAAPRRLRARLEGRVGIGLRDRLASVRQVGLLVAALAVGAGLHVLWDEFSHPRRWGTEHIPALTAQWGLLPGYRWVQYLSGLIGGLVLLVWLALWWRRTPEQEPTGHPSPIWAWALLAAAGVTAALAGALRSPSPGAAAFAGATWGGGVAGAVAVVLAVAWHVGRRVRR